MRFYGSISGVATCRIFQREVGGGGGGGSDTLSKQGSKQPKTDGKNTMMISWLL